MKPPLVESLKLHFSGVSSSLRLANLFVLAAELEHLHKLNNYHIRGPKLKAEAETKRPTWEKFCSLNAGISELSLRNYLECWNVLKFRLHYDSRPEAKAILQLMIIRPSDLSDDERQKMIQGIATLALKKDDTPGTLRKEYREPRKDNSGESQAVAGDGNGHAIPASPVTYHQTPGEMELLALACGVSPENAKRVADIILKDRYQKTLKRAASRAVKLLRERRDWES
jgi:hypothetical protein